MKHTTLFWVFCFLVFTSFSIAAAQDEACEPDLSRATELLGEAQAALGADSLDTALELIAEARSNLELIEASCIDFAAEDAGNSRANPVPVGQRQHFRIFDDVNASIQITGYIDNANGVVDEADQNNHPPDAGRRYIVVEFNFTCEFDPTQFCEFGLIHYSVVGSKGLVYEPDSYVNGFTGSAELFGGAQIPVRIVFMVDRDDTDFLLFNAYDEAVFFATQ